MTGDPQAQSSTDVRPLCPHCHRADHLVYDGDWWTTCKACGKRSAPGAMRRALKRHKERRA